jgi:5'-3' exonuclease
MNNKDLLKLLNNVQEQGDDIPKQRRVLLIDALNLFFRNFAVINAVNEKGIHIGGLGGFFRSLGAMIKQIEPTEVYIVWDGVGSSNNRKNIIPEYKSERNISRITNWEAFDSHEEEDDSKIDQLVRIIQYIKTLPVRSLSIDKVEADDIIAYLSNTLPTNPNDRVFIVSSDKDYLQLVNEQVIVYSPIIKKYYTKNTVEEQFGILPHNFILYKVLMGDNSDKIPGVKGLGEKKLYKLFPELKGDKIELNDILRISENKLKEHIIYARILNDPNSLKKRYKVMDLQNPMIDESDKQYIEEYLTTYTPQYQPQEFIKMYEQDRLGNLIRNVNVWLKECFENLK